MATDSPRVAIVCDALTRAALAPECELRDLTPGNYRKLLRGWRPDLVLVESAWQGCGDAWKHRIAAYPAYPWRSNRALVRLVDEARTLGIPCVFWNKEDGVHFERFIASASLFDTIFTIDEGSVSHYRARLGAGVRIEVLTFPVQPMVHHVRAGEPGQRRTCFVGSYSRHIHPERRAWQDLMFFAAEPYGLTVYDRNSGRRSENYRYPDLAWIDVRTAVAPAQTATIYQDFLVQFNVNTMTDSASAYSRRLVEMLACGAIVVSNPARSVDRWFADYCEIIHDRSECDDVLARIFNGDARRERERALAGAEYVLREHGWARALRQILAAVGLQAPVRDAASP